MSEAQYYYDSDGNYHNFADLLKQIALSRVAGGIAIPPENRTLYVEPYFYSNGSPTDNSGYVDQNKQYLWQVSGAKGSRTLTYLGGDLFSTIGNRVFPVVIHYENGPWGSGIGSYGLFHVVASSGNTITLAEPLEQDITNRNMASVWYQGNHIGEIATRAWVQSIYLTPRTNTLRESYVIRADAGLVPFTVIGSTDSWRIETGVQAPYRADGTVHSRSASGVQLIAANATHGMQWAGIDLKGYSGMLELHIGTADGDSCTLKITIDSNVYTYTIGKLLQTIRLKYTSATTAKIEVFGSANGASIPRVGQITFLADQATNSERLFDPNLPLTVYSDSWAWREIQANGKPALIDELERIMSIDARRPVTVQNVGLSGTISEWGKDNFARGVLPTGAKTVWVIFGVNCANQVAAIFDPKVAATVSQGPVSQAQYPINLMSIEHQAQVAGIQPIFIMRTSGDQSFQVHGAYVETAMLRGALKP